MDDDFTAEGYDVEEDEEYASWITWFCELKGNEFFCMVDREFIIDEFNLSGLSSMVTFYHYALDLILDLQSHDRDRDRLTEEQKRLVEISAETLYGLIHARFITTARGLKLMEEKFVHGDFGGCPRVFCGGQAVLPVGQSDVVRESSVKLFCPKCEDIFYPCSTRHKILDGAFWGTTFPHLLLMQMRDSGVVVQKPTQQYVPRIYGFRIRKPPATVDEGSGNGNNSNNATSSSGGVVGGGVAATTGYSNNNNAATTLTTTTASAAGGGGAAVARVAAATTSSHVDGNANVVMSTGGMAHTMSTSNNNNDDNEEDDSEDGDVVHA